MSIIIDLIGSVVIGALMILMGLRLNASVAGAADSSFANQNVQESLVDLVHIIEHDFRKIGYNITDPKFAIALADSNRIRFRADMNRDGIIDSVEWYVGPPVTTFPNPNIRALYRKVNQEAPTGAPFGITEFNLRYLTQDGVPTTVLSQIWIIEINLKVESPYKVPDQVKGEQTYEEMGYATSFWRQTRLASRNIKRHG